MHIHGSQAIRVAGSFVKAVSNITASMKYKHLCKLFLLMDCRLPILRLTPRKMYVNVGRSGLSLTILAPTSLLYAVDTMSLVVLCKVVLCTVNMSMFHGS